MSNYAAKLVGDAFLMEKKIERQIKEGIYPEYEYIFDPKFRKGLPGIEEENLRNSMVSDVEVTEVVSDEADWDANTVVNEDDFDDLDAAAESSANDDFDGVDGGGDEYVKDSGKRRNASTIPEINKVKKKRDFPNSRDE